MISSRFVDIVFSVLMALLGIYVAIAAAGLGYIANGAPAPGFFPIWIGLGMTALSVWNILRACRAADRLPDIKRREVAYVLIASAMMAGCIGLAFVVGMLAAIFLLMLALGTLFGPRTAGFQVRLLILCLVMTGVVHVIFQRLLDVPGL